MKKTVGSILMVIVILCSGLTICAEDEIKLMVNNVIVECENPPVNIDGRILVPLRALGEAMGCEVIWMQSKQQANIQNDTTLIGVAIGSKYISKQKRTSSDQTSVIEIDVPAQIINGSTYIPVRAVAEAFDAVVGWDQHTNTVMVVYDTSLHYAGDYEVETFAGTGERTLHDSELERMSFVSPESISINDKGEMYVADSGAIRLIADGKSETIEFEPDYITASMLKCYEDDVYILTNEFQNTDGVEYYGIIRLNDAGAEGIFVTEAMYSLVSDFDISNEGRVYLLYNNAVTGINYLGELDVENSKINYLMEVDSGIKALAVDDNGNVFLANTVKGSLYFYDVANNSLKLFAGADNKLKFVDGANPMFFEPRRLDYYDGHLYVLDYNVVRRVSVNGENAAVYCETLAGKISVEQHPETVNAKGSEIVFAPSYLADIMAMENGVYITDPKNAVIRFIHK